MTIKRVALRVLLTSVVIASALAIVGIVGKGFGTLAVHALLTALVVAAGSVLVLGCIGQARCRARSLAPDA